MDVVVTVPKNFTDWSSDGLNLRGLAAWIYEGDAAPPGSTCREIHSTDVVVNLTHGCAWCAEMIYPKAPARKRVYVFDGEFTSDWMHPECFAAYANAPSEDICDGWMAGDFERPAQFSSED